MPSAERDFLRMTEEEVAAFLEEGRRVQVASTNADGSIHLVPMSYFVSSGQIGLWTDPGSRKVSNLQRDPRVTCLVEVGEEFSVFRAVQITGQALVGVPDSLAAGEALFSRSLPIPLSEDVRAYIETLAPQRVAITIVPERVVSWDHRKLAGVRPDAIGS